MGHLLEGFRQGKNAPPVDKIILFVLNFERVTEHNLTRGLSWPSC
jgi:hypothetical protein